MVVLYTEDVDVLFVIVERFTRGLQRGASPEGAGGRMKS
jgi:hypothetical protein